MAYYALEPFGDERADERTASIVQVLANTNRDRKRQPSPYELRDVKLRTPYQALAGEEGNSDLLTKVIGINRVLGGRDDRQ